MSTTPSKTMAAFWMAGWLSLTLVMAVAGREAVREMNVFQVMLVRSLLGLCMLYPMIRRSGGYATLRTTRLPQHVARNLIHYVSQLGWFFALTLIPIGQVVAIEFTMPIWTAILAASFLSERMTSWKIAAIVLGLVGVIVIVRPATGEINQGQLIALGAAIGFGVSMALVKSLTRTESALADPVPGCWSCSRSPELPAGALRLGLAARLRLGVGWPSSPSLPALSRITCLASGDALRGRDRGGSHGLLAGPIDRHGRLAALFRAAGRLDRARRGPDPVRQSPEFEAGRAGSCPRIVNRRAAGGDKSRWSSVI